MLLINNLCENGVRCAVDDDVEVIVVVFPPTPALFYQPAEFVHELEIY